jgi:uncharacterized protein DUF4157
MRQRLQRRSPVATTDAVGVARPPAIRARDPVIEPTASQGPGLDLSRVPVRNEAPARIQAKLTVGQADDPLEREADRVADQVIRMPEPRGGPEDGLRRNGGTVPPIQANRAGAGGNAGFEAPPIVHDVLRSPGHPLDAATRAFAEPRFGRDFSDVRIHADTTATASAKAINALAYTSGTHAAFDAQSYNPASPGGRRLIAHELAHVVQQQGTGGRLQRQSKPAPQPQSQPAPQPQSQPAAQPQPAAQSQPTAAPTPTPSPEAYGNTSIAVTAPPQPYTLKEAKDFVAKRTKETPPALTSGSVKGALPGSDAEIFLWHILASVARRDWWGTENDLIEPIGWPPKPLAPYTDPSTPYKPSAGAPAPKPPMGAVTVRIDQAGVGEAELVSAKIPVASTTYADPAAASTGLTSAYGLKSVTDDGSATWTAVQLNIVSDAFALLPAADKAALKGVILRRVKEIDPEHSAQFSRNLASVAKGATAATTQDATLDVGNSAFGGDDRLFVGSGSAAYVRSTRAILHEVGHAIESQAFADTHQTTATNVAARNKALEPYNDAIDKRNKLIGSKKTDPATLKEIDDLAKVTAAKKPAVTKATAAQDTARKAEAATLVPAKDVAAGLTTMKAEGTAADAALKTAQTAAGTFAQKDSDESQAYRKSVEDLSKAIGDYAKLAETTPATLNVKDQELLVDAAVKKRDGERAALQKAAAANPALTQFAAVEASQTSWAIAVKTQARLPKRTVRLQNFVDTVKANKIEPFTAYAKQNWPHNPTEFYAEAYSLWRTDPEYLKANAKAVFDWFEAGHYRD